MTIRCFRFLIWISFIFAVGLRLLLYWINPPSNAFDNHFDPIFWIMKFGTIPPKNALWQSYQPPVFYAISAMVGKFAMGIGVSAQLIPKILQLISCLYGLLTIYIIYLILKKVPLSDFSRLLAFGSVCFLPRHIYMSAMHSNDTIASLSVVFSVYLMLIALERKFSYPVIVMSSIGITIAIFTKYTSFVVIPVAISALAPIPLQRIIIPKKRAVIACVLLIIIPLLFLSGYCYSNVREYHTPLPWNSAMLAPRKTQPRAENGLSFINFKPWETIRTPILTPWNIDSFWTLIYSRMWFDVEPKFLYYTDKDVSWWKSYYQWLRGERRFPSDIRLSDFTYFTGSAMIAMGLIPLFFIIAGVCRYILCKIGLQDEINSEGAVENQIFLVLFLFNAAGIIALTFISPVYSSVKATYFAGSLPAFSVSLGFGVMAFEKHRLARWVMAFLFGALFALVAMHIIHIACSLSFRVGM